MTYTDVYPVRVQTMTVSQLIAEADRLENKSNWETFDDARYNFVKTELRNRGI